MAVHLKIARGLFAKSYRRPARLPESARFFCASPPRLDRRRLDLAQSVQLAKLVGPLGVDLIDCSSAGFLPEQRFQFAAAISPFAEEIRRQTGLLTGR